MRIVKYTVRFPTPDDPTKFTEFEYNSPIEVCSALKVARSTMYAIIKGDSKLDHKHLRHIKGVQIIRIPAKSTASSSKTVEQINQEIKLAQQNLYNQMMQSTSVSVQQLPTCA